MPKGRKGSLLVLQSGGPTHVINQSLAGVFHEAERSGAFERVLGADHGPRGLIDGKFIDLSAQSKAVWRAVARTPGSALGTARRKITDEDLPRRLRGASGAQRHLPGEHRRQRLRRERPPLLCRGAKSGTTRLP